MNLGATAHVYTDMLLALKLASRSLKRSLGFTVLTVLFLGFGIGITTTMFSIVRTVIVKPLPFPNDQQLVNITFRAPAFSKQLSSIPANAQHLQFWREHAHILKQVGLIEPDSRILSGVTESQQVYGVRISTNVLKLLGIPPVVGRYFSRDEDLAGSDQVTIISYALSQRVFNGSRRALGKSLFLNGRPYKVIGVMPRSYPFPTGEELSNILPLPEHIDYWIPLTFTAKDLGSPIANMNYAAIARLQPHNSPEQAAQDLALLEPELLRKAAEHVQLEPVVRPLRESISNQVRTPLLMLMCAVSVVLVLVCLNLMNLMMVRGLANRRQWAIRLAFGCSPSNILGGVFVESVILSLLGCCVGILTSFWMLRLVRFHAPIGLPRADEIRMDTGALVFTVAISVTCAILFGLLPASRISHVNCQEVLQSSSRSVTEGRRGRRIGRLLIIAEVALSTVLLLVVGLLLRSYINVLSVNPGFSVSHVITAKIALPPDQYRNRSQLSIFYRNLRESVRSLPGVNSVATVSSLPLTPGGAQDPVTAGDAPIQPITKWPIANLRAIGGDYFAASGIPLVAGEPFRDDRTLVPEVIISSNLAAHLWPGISAIGHPLRIRGNGQLFTVIGVAAPVRANSLTERPTMMVYMPDWQDPKPTMFLLVSTANPTISASLRQVVRHLDPQVAVSSIESMHRVISTSLIARQFQLVLLGIFAAAALLLSAFGIYAVVSFITGQQATDIGIRMALGATPLAVVRSTFQTGLIPVLLGMAGGLCLAVSIGRLIQASLFGVQLLDLANCAVTVITLTVTAVLACMIPAMRAARVTPVTVLKGV